MGKHYGMKPSKPLAVFMAIFATGILAFGIIGFLSSGEEFHPFIILWCAVLVGIIGFTLWAAFSKKGSFYRFESSDEGDNKSFGLMERYIKMKPSKPIAIFAAIVGVGMLAIAIPEFSGEGFHPFLIFWCVALVGIIVFNLWAAFSKKGSHYRIDSSEDEDESPTR